MQTNSNINVVVVGGSAGGISALQDLLKNLDNGFERPIVAVLHLPSDSQIDAKLIFSRFTKYTVEEVRDKMPIQNRHLYLAPPGYHLLIEEDFCFSLTQEPVVNYSRPSIDVLFESAAKSLGSSLCGILLSGANRDGAVGLAVIQNSGGVTLVQDPKTSEVSTMPESAIELFTPTLVASISELAAFLSQCHGRISLDAED